MIDLSSVGRSLASGAVGATTVTLLNESVRQMRSDAPRLQRLGMRALARGMRTVGMTPPRQERLYTMSMAGDLLANSLYYSLVGLGGGRRTWGRGALLGLAAGIGGVLLPPRMGLGRGPTGRTPQTKAMTVAWYFAGGLAAAAVASLLAGREKGEVRETERAGEAREA